MGSVTTTSNSAGSIGQKALDYYRLVKPGILRLLVVTAFCTMLVAARGMPDLWLVFWTILGTVLICGSANVFNMVWDRDIDPVMKRTQERPIPQGRIDPQNALIFAGVLGFSAVLILTYFVNPLAALMGICGHAYYVIIYTMWLKRRTPHNIVIGGGAGAFPALIGWAAVTGDLSMTAWIIFAIVFLWTPPHFWALALYKDVEYHKANIPMMPVVRGKHVTKFQMLLYTALLLGATTLLAIVGMMGIIYLVASVVLGAVFAYMCIRTAFDTTDKWAKRTFAYSILYLALLFGAMSVDSFNTHHFTEHRYLAGIEQQAERMRAEQDKEELRSLHNGELPAPKTSQQ
ncbi:protoheme IX farnesyltransferase [Persicimonas caeni]|uniref:Protoheme IX farnesyltransferase n=1 Tax=Persicimonas caeni TaxID=2292766 RepID=A0A4Y6PPC7_PERCE|nr:heme o synthase [Persicimonas caeni]QDG49857.1 protoheme IX farnesyltransferase [Persicimonas caeni]QED31078.1 protoheme IX farnesyltransferase [Persicimonas caeni]